MLSGRTMAFVSNVSSDERISAEVSEQVGVAGGVRGRLRVLRPGRGGRQEAGLDEPTTEALVGDYASAQIQALKAGLLAAE